MLASLSVGAAACGSVLAAGRTKESILEVLKLAVGSGENVAGRVAVVVDEGVTSVAAFGSSDAPGVAMVSTPQTA